jgi:hypothetical protein
MASFKNLISNTSAQISSGGTITGDLVINGDLQVDGGGSLSFDEIIEGTQVIDVTNTEALLVRKNGDGGDVFTVDTTNSKVIVGDISLSGSTISDNSALTISSGDDIVIDAESDVNIDANGGDIRFKDNGTNFVTFSSVGSTGTIFTNGSSSVSITPDGNNSVVKLDKSATNRGARFEYSTATSAKWYQGLSDSDHFSSGGDEYFISEDFTTPRFIIEPGGNIGMGVLPSYPLHVENVSDTVAYFKSTDNNGQIAVVDDDTTAYFGANGSRAFMGTASGLAGTTNLVVDSNGNVIVGQTTAQQKFEVHGGGIRIAGNITTPSSGVTGALIDYFGSDTRFWSRGADASTVGSFKFIGLENDGGNQSTQLEIDSSGNATFAGNVGIGGAPSNILDIIKDATDGGETKFLRMLDADTNTTADTEMIISFQKYSSGTSAVDVGSIGMGVTGWGTVSSNRNTFMSFKTVSSGSRAEKMRIDSSGNVGIGTNSPSQMLHIASSTDAFIQLERVDTSVADNDAIGAILFRGGESSIADIGRIRLHADADFTSSSSPTKMVFETTPSGATADAVALTLDSSQNATFVGNVDVGARVGTAIFEVQGSVDNDYAGRFENTHSGGYGALVKIAGTTANDLAFQVRADSTNILTINGDSSSTFAGKVKIDQDSNNFALEIDSENTTANAILVECDALTSNGIARFYSNSSDSSSRNLVQIVNNHASASGATPLKIEQNSSGVVGDFKNSHASGYGLKIQATDANVARYIATFNDKDDNMKARIHGDGGATFSGDVKIENSSASAKLEFKRTSSNTANFLLQAYDDIFEVYDLANSRSVIKLDANSRISLSNTDSGTGNTIFGKSTATSLDAGSNYNVLIGGSIATGSMNDATHNVAVGSDALQDITSGDNNVAIGSSALLNITSGEGNTIIGRNAADALLTGNKNIAIGRLALSSSQDADNCIAIGYAAMNADNVAASDGSIAIGYAAMNNLTSGAGNVGVGYEVLNDVTTGEQNTAVGFYSLDAEVDGDKSTAVGYQALTAQTGTSGTVGNTAVGFQAGSNITTGIENTILGAFSTISAVGGQNQTVIGSGVTGTGNNEIALGNTSISAIKAQVSSITAYSSDERTKKDIADYDLKGVDFIKELNLKTYIYKNPADFPDEIRDSKWDEDGVERLEDPTETQVGLIAQEVESALAKHSVGNTETYAPTQDSGIKTLTYGNLIFPLIKAVQELSARVEELEGK